MNHDVRPLLLLWVLLSVAPLAQARPTEAIPPLPAQQPLTESRMNDAPDDSVRVLQVHEPVKILWSGTWYDGHVLEIGDGVYKVRYDGWGAAWDEWVGVDRLKTPEGAPVAAPASRRAPPRAPLPDPGPPQPPAGEPAAYAAGDKVWVYWTGASYRATIREARDGQYLIHYDGYESEWDEWVTPGRISGKITAEAPSSAGALPSGGQPHTGNWECVTWDGSMLNRIAGFDLAENGQYTDLNTKQTGRYRFGPDSGRIVFESGPQKTDAVVTFDPNGRSGKGHIIFHYSGGVRLDCYRAR